MAIAQLAKKPDKTLFIVKRYSKQVVPTSTIPDMKGSKEIENGRR